MNPMSGTLMKLVTPWNVYPGEGVLGGFMITGFGESEPFAIASPIWCNQSVNEVSYRSKDED